MIEIWKTISEYENYEVSNTGKVKSKARIANRKTSNYIKKDKLLTPCKNSRQYYYVTLRKNNTSKAFRVHRLVAEAFIPNLENKPQVNHINGIKSDNKVENLEWTTARENSLHAYSIGLTKKNNLLTGIALAREVNIKKVLMLDKLGNHIKTFNSLKEAADEINISASNISMACSGKLNHAAGYIWKYQ